MFVKMKESYFVNITSEDFYLELEGEIKKIPSFLKAGVSENILMELRGMFEAKYKETPFFLSTQKQAEEFSSLNIVLPVVSETKKYIVEEENDSKVKYGIYTIS